MGLRVSIFNQEAHMQQKRILPKKLYHACSIDETNYSEIVWIRKEKLDKAILLFAEGCSDGVVFEALNISRSSYYRWKRSYEKFGLEGLEDESRRPHCVRKETWTSQVEINVYHLRKKYPLWGKRKVAIMYKRKYGDSISESTIGRIISKLIKQAKIMPVRFMFGKKDIQHRKFNGHAQRWKYGMKGQRPGELIQIDHMTTGIPGIGQVKTFNAVCPVTKQAAFKVYKEANSMNAADFLNHLREVFPFPIISIQVDGGSEFMAEFEKACYMAKIPLFVLPPRKPKWNGGVERGNATIKYEFYAQYDGPPSLYHLQKRLQKFAHFYNCVRPHEGIGLLTPRRFYEVISYKRSQSHMS